MNCYTAEVKWVEKPFLTVLRECGDTVERERKMLDLSFNSFPCCYSYLFYFEHSVSVTGFIIWTVHVFFKQNVSVKHSALFDLYTDCYAETASFSGLTLVSKIISAWMASNMFPKVTAFSRALSSVLPHNSSRWQLGSSVLLLCVGSYGGKNVLLFIQWTFRLICINGLLEKVFNVLARLHMPLI